MEEAAAGKGCGHGSRTLDGVEPAAEVEITIGGEMMERSTYIGLFISYAKLRTAHVL